MLAYRRAIGDALIEWEGERAIEPPPAARRTQARLDDNWSVEGLKAQRARAVVPDAVLEIARPNSNGKRVFLIEYDRTTRVDKNYEKFRRYDAFLTSWWRHTEFSGAPWVLFVCQHETHRDQFLAAADRDITGRLWHPSAQPDEIHRPGRSRILFTCEADIHAGILEARRVPGYPPGHPARRGPLAECRGVRLPGPKQVEDPLHARRPTTHSHDGATLVHALEGEGTA